FTFRNCLPARGEALWIARAKTSLPVPLSPRRSTVVFVPATFVTRSRIGCIFMLVQSAINGSVIGCPLLGGVRCTSRQCLHRIALHVPRVYPPQIPAITSTSALARGSWRPYFCRKFTNNCRTYTGGGNQMEIMIVDDEPQVAEVLATSLKRQGHSTTVVHSGRDAL